MMRRKSHTMLMPLKDSIEQAYMSTIGMVGPIKVTVSHTCRRQAYAVLRKGSEKYLCPYQDLIGQKGLTTVIMVSNQG